MTRPGQAGRVTYKATAVMITMLITGAAVTGCSSTAPGTNDKVTTPPRGPVALSSTRTSPDLVPLDHVVPLALSWDLGAAHWSQAKRVKFANDPTIELLAVDERSNSKNPAAARPEYMPAQRSFWCSYDQRFVTILTHYRLKVTAADKTAMTRVLAHC